MRHDDRGLIDLAREALEHREAQADQGYERLLKVCCPQTRGAEWTGPDQRDVEAAADNLRALNERVGAARHVLFEAAQQREASRLDWTCPGCRAHGQLDPLSIGSRLRCACGYECRHPLLPPANGDVLSRFEGTQRTGRPNPPEGER